MQRHRISAEQWLKTAVSGIRFRPDREAVERELNEHIEDKIAGLRRIFPDMTAEEAQERALSQMGDPAEIGRELTRIHRPWLGYLWRCSRWAAAAAVLLAVLLWTPRLMELVRVWAQNWDQPVSYNGSVERCYQRGIDPFGENGLYPQEQTDVVRTPLMVSRPQETVGAGGYALRVDQAALWSFQRETENRVLFCNLRVRGWPWQPAALQAVWRVQGVDSSGKRYYSADQVYNQNMDYEAAGGGYITVNSIGGTGWEEQFSVDVSGVAPGARWLRLEYDYGGVEWTLTIPIDTQEVEDG